MNHTVFQLDVTDSRSWPIFTARIPNEWGKVLFSQASVCSYFGEGGTPIQLMGGTPSLPDRGGTPHPRSGRGVPPSQVRMGGSTPIPGQDGGYPHPRSGRGGTPNWNSTACTCYAAGGMPLAFTQDFLV